MISELTVADLERLPDDAKVLIDDMLEKGAKLESFMYFEIEQSRAFNYWFTNRQVIDKIMEHNGQPSCSNWDCGCFDAKGFQ